jgi:D-aspartate ligase
MITIRNTLVPIVILQFAPVHHHGGLGIARTAGRLGVRVYWVHGQSWAPATLSRYVYKRIYWDGDAPAEISVDFLLKLGRQIGRESILIPIDDRGAIFVADHTEALKERFLFPDQPPGLARSLSSKKEMHFLCNRMGIPTPAASFPQCGDDVAAFAETAIFPVVMKRIVDWLPEHRTQMESVTIVNSAKDLLELYEKIEAWGEPNMMLQEYIPGGPESVWMFNGCFANDSECLVGFTGKKIRQIPPFTGATTLGICLKNDMVEDMTKDFMRKIGYSGIVDMGYRYDRRDGRYKLLDVNPRVGATFRLFVDSNEMDVVRALYLYVTGQEVIRGVPYEGRKWAVEPDDLIASVQYGRRGKLTIPQWASSLRGIEEVAWFAWDDPVPFAAMCWTSLGRAVSKVMNRVKIRCTGRKRLYKSVS